MDLVDQFQKASDWTSSKIAGATDQLDAQTPCEEWKVRDVIGHLIDGQVLFQGAARGEPSAPPTGAPKPVGDADPVGDYDTARNETLSAFKQPGAIEKAGFVGAIAWVDQLVHGWDIAKATGQDTTMPSDLAEAAFANLDGKFPTDGSTPFFAKAVEVPADASAQDKLLGLAGRQP